jgi:sulfite reductase (ferredoxin)
LYERLEAVGLARVDPPILRSLISCAGASTCKLGICLSRGLAKAIARELSQSGLDIKRLGRLRINISGCPNSCGRHPLADIGFFGAARRIKGRLVPHYVVQLGGYVEEGKTTLASGNSTVPGRNICAYLKDFLKAYEESPHWPDFERFLQREGRKRAEDLALKYRDVPDFEDDKNFYYDWDAEEVFSLAGRGPGECGAGVFDLIEVDLTSAREALSERKYYTAAALAARALLVTRGVESKSDAEAFTLFREHFLNQNLVDGRFRELVEAGVKCRDAADCESAFETAATDVAALVQAVQTLYDNMDASLKFVPTDENAGKEEQLEREPTPACPARDESVDRSCDFRGVLCPLNYVKTKLVLEQMKDGQVLSVLLDEEGARNVPQSAEQDGHQVLSVASQEEGWRVVIRKAKE